MPCSLTHLHTAVYADYIDEIIDRMGAKWIKETNNE